MHINSLLSEMSLPADWDASKIETGSFKNKLAYAAQMAKRIGAGSSRVAFIMPYEGRNTILKMAKNRKGLGQNELEVERLTDWIISDSGFAIPLIDYDKNSSQPTWIQTEFARKATNADFVKTFGVPFEKLFTVAYYLIGKSRGEPSDPQVAQAVKAGRDSDGRGPMYDFSTMLGNYDFDQYTLADMQVMNNWGMYNGHPVILDWGYDSNISSQYYNLR